MREWLEFLVVVKTSPLVSTVINVPEHVCTAGVRRDGTWIRIYPVSFRLLHESEKYRKYQWIELEVVKAKGDKRPESYRPTNSGGIKCGEFIAPDDYWQRRREYVIPPIIKTMCEYNQLERNECSLGVVKPFKVTDVIEKEVSSEWPEKYKKVLQQPRLFDGSITPLRKLPYEFRYRFKCSSECNTDHHLMILDWELTALYWNELKRLGSPQRAANSVKYKYLDDLCGTKKDTYFFVGTDHLYGNWMVTGVFAPAKRPPTLFI